MAEVKQKHPITVNGVPLTDDDIGRRVRYQRYEGYQNTQVLKGEGTIKSIDYTYGQVHVSTGQFRTTYFRGYSSGRTDVVTIFSEYDHKTGNRELNRGKSDGWQLEMPKTYEHVFEFIEEDAGSE